jgi:translocation and assembly module TamA
MRRFFLLFFLCLVLIPEPLLAAVVLDVEVSGLDQEMSANVLARLGIYQQQKNPGLNVGEMRRLHRKAGADIKAALEPLGYYGPEIASALVEAEGVWHASYIVAPGEPVLVRSVTVNVTGPGSALSLFSDLDRRIPLLAGEALKHQHYEDGKKNILQWAVKNGFVEARFDKNEIRVHRANHQADIELLLNTGHRFLFGTTHSDQEIISQKLLARYLPYKQGDPYSVSEVSRLQSILYETGFFSGVTVEPEFDKAVDLEVPVALTLSPALWNRYSLGLGYGTDTGIRGKMEWRNRLFNEDGHKVHSSLQLSERLSKIDGSYEIPVADPRYDALKYSGGLSTETWDGTSTQLASVATSLSHSEPEKQYGATLEIRNEVYDVGATSGTSLLLLPGASWSMIFADNRINTENGWRFSVDLMGADKNIVSDATFLRAQAGVKGIASLFEQWRVIGRFTLGGTAVDSIDDLPPSLRFYAGGDQSVRGYGYKSIGPVDSSGTVIGGRYLMVGSVEVERKIDDLWSWVAFYDTGQATDSMTLDLKKSVGVGGRVTLPFGQVRLDIAVPLMEEENAFRIHLNVGADL